MARKTLTFALLAMLALTADRLISSYCSHPNPYHGIVESGRLFAWASQQQHHLR